MVSAITVSIAPAAIDSNKEITDSGTSANTTLPTADKIPVKSMIDVHIIKILGMEKPCSFMPLELDNASG